MSLEDQMKIEEAKQIFQFLAAEEWFGNEFTPYRIAEDPNTRDIKTTNTRVKDLLSLTTIKFPEILGYKEIGVYNLFWIISDQDTFRLWLKEWFGKEF